MHRRSMRNIAGLTMAVVVVLAGCMTIRRSQAQDTEQLLVAAGFTIERIDASDATPDDATSYRLVSRINNDTVRYTYTDPTNCRCIYVGGSKEFAEYQRLATERRMADERWRAADNAWGRYSWGPWWRW